MLWLISQSFEEFLSFTRHIRFKEMHISYYGRKFNSISCQSLVECSSYFWSHSKSILIYIFFFLIKSSQIELSQYTGRFQLQFFVFPFVYQFNSRIRVLDSQFIICKWLVEGLQQHFSIISKFVCCGCGFYKKKHVAFIVISFAILKWGDFLSVQLPFEIPVQILVQFLLVQVLEPDLPVQNVSELKLELSRM